MADEQQHQRTIVQEGAKYRPTCSCGWRGRLSRSTDQAGGQFSSHTAKLWSAARALGVALPVKGQQ